MNETGIYLQYRSYLNYHLPADDPTVVFPSFGEIASARFVKERVATPDPAKPSATQTQHLRYVDLQLSGDIATLTDALQVERAEHAPSQKRWYGTSSTLCQDYPVSLTAPMLLRIRWDVVPRRTQVSHSPATPLGYYRSCFDEAGLHAPEVPQPRRPTETTPRTCRPRGSPVNSTVAP